MQTTWGVSDYIAEMQRLREENAALRAEMAELRGQWLVQHDEAVRYEERYKMANATAEGYKQLYFKDD